jgi:hypothetical protein
MEGVFTYRQGEVAIPFLDRLLDGKSRLNICSLSKIHDSTLMWSYYASAHKGIVMGVEVDSDSPGVVSIQDVNYTSNTVFEPFAGSDPEIEARNVLTRKLTPWEHEKEVRILTHATFVPISIRSIHIGCKMEKSTSELVKKLIGTIRADIDVRTFRREDLDRPIRDNSAPPEAQ